MTVTTMVAYMKVSNSTNLIGREPGQVFSLVFPDNCYTAP